MSQPSPSVRTDDDRLIVEAPTAEAALELVAARLGTRARISNVERVRRGGVGGFFARELVQVTALGDDAPSASGTQDDGPPESDSAVERLLRKIADRDDPFAAALQHQLTPPQAADGPPDRPANHAAGHVRTSADGLVAQRAASAGWPPASAVGSRIDAHLDAPPSGTPTWSVRNLVRLGLPPLLSTGDAAYLAPTDDIGWTHALAASLGPICGPLPSGSTIVVGPAAERLAGRLDLAVHWPGQQTPPESFVAPISGSDCDREWLASAREGRHLHLVVGGPGWRGLLFDEPAALSYTEESMCEAISLAAQLGIALGFTCHTSGEVRRANPVDVAMAIRRLLPTHA